MPDPATIRYATPPADLASGPTRQLSLFDSVCIIVGVIGLLIGGFAAIKVSSLQKTVAEQQPKIDKVDTIEASVTTTQGQVDGLKKEFATAVRTTNDGFTFFNGKLETLAGTVTRLEEEMKKKPAPVATKGGSSGPVTAGPGEYVIKSKDTFSTIGRANGVSAADIAAVNPNVNSASLKIGQKIKLPSTAKK